MSDKQRRSKYSDEELDEEYNEKNRKNTSKKKKKKRHILLKIFVVLLMLIAILLGTVVGFTYSMMGQIEYTGETIDKSKIEVNEGVETEKRI